MIKQVRLKIHKIKLLVYPIWPLKTLTGLKSLDSPPDHTLGENIGTCTEWLLNMPRRVLNFTFDRYGYIHSKGVTNAGGIVINRY